MSELSGKKIAIDISIYLYKFSAEDALIENIYLMLSIFKHYNVTPLFIFDGKPPKEKKDVLEKRKDDKIKAKKEYDELKIQLENDEKILDAMEKQEITATMDTLKSKFISIQKDQIQKVKNLISAFGGCYCDAPGEADELCAYLTVKGKVWASMSEDMDLFVYGCTRVLRYFSLIKHTCVLYDTVKIFEDLGISEKDFRQICILSGTDYNTNSDKNSYLYRTLKLYKKYHKQSKNENENIDFYDWIHQKTNYIQDYQAIKKIYNLFDLNDDATKSFENLKFSNSSYDKLEIRKILEKEWFIF
jgi:flap endonuclease-1